MTLSILLGLLACGDIEPDNEESIEDTDTETETVEGTQVTIALSGGQGLKVGLVQVVFPQDDGSDDSDGGPEFKDTRVLSTELTDEDSFTFGLEIPNDSELSQLDPSIPAQMGLWAPFLFEDSNGDDAYNEGESIGGLSMTWLVFSTMDIPQFNVTEGWSAIEMTFTEEAPRPADISNIPLTQNLLATEAVTIGGSYDTALGDRRIAIIASATLETDIEVMVDAVASDPWSLTLEGAPPEHHFMDMGGISSIAPAVAFAYQDFNGSGTFDLEDLLADTFAPTLCFEGDGALPPQPISILYSKEPTDFRTAMYSGMYGMGSGWSILVSDDDGPVPLTGEDLEHIVINSDCIWE